MLLALMMPAARLLSRLGLRGPANKTGIVKPEEETAMSYEHSIYFGLAMWRIDETSQQRDPTGGNSWDRSRKQQCSARSTSASGQRRRETTADQVRGEPGE